MGDYMREIIDVEACLGSGKWVRIGTLKKSNDEQWEPRYFTKELVQVRFNLRKNRNKNDIFDPKFKI